MSEQEIDPIDPVEETEEVAADVVEQSEADDNGPGSNIPGGH